MGMRGKDAPQIYLDCIQQTVQRLDGCDEFLKRYQHTNNLFELEAAVLQLRKAMESMAFAAIAPNKEQYAALRKQAERPVDFGQDWNAKSIFLSLDALNKYFYPAPLGEPELEEGVTHFKQLEGGYLKRREFETFYNRIGMAD